MEIQVDVSMDDACYLALIAAERGLTTEEQLSEGVAALVAYWRAVRRTPPGTTGTNGDTPISLVT